MTANSPTSRLLILSGWMTYSRPLDREPNPVSRPAPGARVCWVVIHDPRVPAIAATSSAEAAMVCRPHRSTSIFPAIWGRIPPPPPGRVRVGGSKIANLLGADQLAEPRTASPAEEARGLRRATGRVLVDDDKRRALLPVLTFVADRDGIECPNCGASLARDVEGRAERGWRIDEEPNG